MGVSDGFLWLRISKHGSLATLFSELILDLKKFLVFLTHVGRFADL